MTSSSISTQILQMDLQLARNMHANLSGVQKGLSHVFLGQKFREFVTSQTITSSIVSPETGLPLGERGLIVGLTA